MRALLTLLGDEEERVATVAWDTLLSEGAAAVPYLEEGTRAADPRLRGRARLLLEELRTRRLETEWQEYCALTEEEMDLERGCMLLTGLPGQVDVRALRSFLDATAGLAREHMAATGAARQALGEVLFENLGFKGGDFADPGNHYLSTVLERRTGIPILLCSIYVLVGQRLGLPVSGVASPEHYLARFDEPAGPVFVDCYNRGRVYRQETLVDWLHGRGVLQAEKFLDPCGVRFTLFRMLNNLERVYQGTKDTRMVATVQRWRFWLGVDR